MVEDPRLHRRIAGAFIAREAELRLATVPEPRDPRGLRWKVLPNLLRLCLLGLMAGCKGFRQLESLSAEMSLAWRRRLKIPRRLPDTTARTLICKLEPEPLRDCLRAQVKAAHRRKALAPSWDLPFGAVSIDGKYTAIGAWDELYAQKQEHSAAVGVSGVVRTMTCCLISSRAKACLDASPIPSATNEIAHYPTVLQALHSAYGALNLFQVVTSDAGAASEANARLTVERYKKDYLFRLNAQQPTLYRDARKILGRRRPEQADATTVDIRGNVQVTRRLYLTSELAGYLGWDHLQTVLRVQVEEIDLRTGEIIEREEERRERYYLSSLKRDALSGAQWLELVRGHWGVENNNHCIWDKIIREDDQPWIVEDKQGNAPKAAVVLMLLRRMAYNLLALYRSVTQRAEEKRETPWKDLMRWVYNTLIAATDKDLQGLRVRAGRVA